MAKQIKGNFALGAGYAVVLGLLIFSTVEVYRLQRSLSTRGFGVYHRHIARENSLLELRDLVWLGTSKAREYMLSGDVGRFRAQIEEIQEQGSSNLAGLPPDVDEGFREFAAALTDLAAVQPESGGLALRRLEQDLRPHRLHILAVLNRVAADTRVELTSAETEFSNSQRAIVWQLLVVLGVSLIAGGITASIALRFVRKWHRERSAHFDEMARLSARLLDVQEEERRFLARELHDEVGQTLTALSMELGPALTTTGHPEVRERLQRSRRLVERAMRTVSDISFMLRPPLLDDLGLEAALEWHVHEFSRRSGIRADFFAEEPTLELADEIKTCIYRVAQEALNNCEKYSFASRVRLLLRCSKERLVLEICDDGIGFDMNTFPTGHGGTGLLGIRERVARLGGSSVMETSPGEGAQLVVILPMRGRVAALGQPVLTS